MAVAGLLFVFYVLMHMYGNLKLFAGQEAFDGYAHHLRILGEPILPYSGFLWIFRLLLLTALITLVAAPFTAVSWAVPAVLALLGAGCVAGLRYLAIEDHRARRAPRPAAAPAPPAQQKLFDNEDEARQEESGRQRDAHAAPETLGDTHLPGERLAEPAPEPAYTVAELRAEALRVARSSAGSGSSAATWEPVPVPKPLYTQAPVVQRREPEPLRVPQRPAARSASLKDAVQAGSREPDALNLDDVLKRRRA